MKTLKKIAWRVYNKITHYEQEIIDEFEFRLLKELEEKYYNLMMERNKAINDYAIDGDQHETWLNGSATGEAIAYKCVWNNIYDRFRDVCVRTGRVDEFKRLKTSRVEDGQNQ